MVEDTIVLLHAELQKEINILIEGANATMLDIDFGKFPKALEPLLTVNL